MVFSRRYFLKSSVTASLALSHPMWAATDSSSQHQVRVNDRVAEASSGKTPSAGDRVAFPMDDQTIPWRDNLKLTLERPQKFSGNPVLKPGDPETIDGYEVLVYGTVIKQGSKFRMWYLAGPRGDSRIPGDVERTSYYRPVAYAESTDGVHWEKPNLGLVEFRGNKNNNIVLIEPSSDPFSRPYDFVAVLHEPDDPDPNRRYKMAFISYMSPELPRRGPTTATAVSPDGLRWKLVSDKMFTKGYFENTSLIKFDGLYYCGGQNIAPYGGALTDGSPAGRVMKVFFSPNFRHWSNSRALAFYRSVYKPEPASHGQEVHMGAGLWNRGNVILGFYGQWHGDTIHGIPQHPLKGLKIDLGFVISNDAIHYREPVREFVMVPHGAPDEWDSEGVLQGNTFANTETETLIWYSTWDTSRPNVIPPLPDSLPESMLQKRGIGLARMPRDRFGSFSKIRPGQEASCLTQSFRLQRPCSLHANVEGASSAAPLRIAVVDDAERPLAGYTSELETSSLKTEVAWEAQKLLPADRPFRIKVTWPAGRQDPKLYALYLEQA